jgi:hypothetical protein
MKVFLSHLRGARNELVAAIESELESLGVSTTRPERFPDDGPWQSRIESELDQCDAVLMLVEPGERDRSRQHSEWIYIITAGWRKPELRLVPVLLDGAAAPKHFARLSSVSISAANPGETARRLATMVHDRLNDLTPASRLSARSPQDRQEWLAQRDRITLGTATLPE